MFLFEDRAAWFVLCRLHSPHSVLCEDTLPSHSIHWPTKLCGGAAAMKAIHVLGMYHSPEDLSSSTFRSAGPSSRNVSALRNSSWQRSSMPCSSFSVSSVCPCVQLYRFSLEYAVSRATPISSR